VGVLEFFIPSCILASADPVVAIIQTVALGTHFAVVCLQVLYLCLGVFVFVVLEVELLIRVSFLFLKSVYDTIRSSLHTRRRTRECMI